MHNWHCNYRNLSACLFYFQAKFSLSFSEISRKTQCPLRALLTPNQPKSLLNSWHWYTEMGWIHCQAFSYQGWPKKCLLPLWRSFLFQLATSVMAEWSGTDRQLLYLISLWQTEGVIVWVWAQWIPGRINCDSCFLLLFFEMTQTMIFP